MTVTMNEEEVETFHIDRAQVQRWMNLGKALIVGGFLTGLWVATIQLEQARQAEQADKIDTLIDEQTRLMVSLDKRLAVREFNQFTSSDWSDISKEWMATVNSQDKRITRNEDAVVRIETAIKEVLREVQGR